MSGYAMVMSACVSCGRVFSYNPHRVPSLRRTPEGPREPICRRCVDAANPERIRKGLAPINILPGAYEPIRAEEL